MPTSTLVGDPATIATQLGLTNPPGIAFRPLARSDSSSLAQLYLDSYPPGVAAADLAEAQAEVEATFTGEYGDLWTDASLVATNQSQVVGSIQVVRRSIWDADLKGPFIIEMFVSPATRHQGIATALLSRSANVCRNARHPQIALRTGEGTSPHAQRLYRRAGMSAS